MTQTFVEFVKKNCIVMVTYFVRGRERFANREGTRDREMREL
jgi:hypothetical protein